MSAIRHLQPRVFFAQAERVRILEFQLVRDALQRAHVPAGIEQIFFERPAGAPSAFDQPDALGARAVQHADHGHHRRRVRVMSHPERATLKLQRRAAGEVHLDRHRLVLHQLGGAAQLIEHPYDLIVQLIGIRGRRNDDRRGRRRRRPQKRSTSGKGKQLATCHRYSLLRFARDRPELFH